MEHVLAKVYLAIALVFGTVMVFVNPPFQSPDEPNHFFRAPLLGGVMRALDPVPTAGLRCRAWSLSLRCPDGAAGGVENP